MTQRVLGPKESPRRRWTLLVALTAVFALGLLYIAGASAQLDKSFFELDKDASTNNTFTNTGGLPGKIGVLNAAVPSETGTTSITICQDQSAFYNGAKILVDAERMTLADGANATGGGCPSGFSFKRDYTASRGVDSTTPGAHAKAEDVSKFSAATPSASHDWNEVYEEIANDADSTCASLGAVECTFLSDGRAMSIFTQSKDYDEISDDAGATAFWKWRDQSVPDADELDDGAAIKYIDGSGDQHIFLMMDRFAVNGTKDTGIWLLHDEVAAVDPVGGGDGTFTGLHTEPDPGTNGVFCKQEDGGNIPGGQAGPTPACNYDDDDTGGDVFLASSFSGGGATVTIRVFEWVGPAGSTAALLERGTGADCVPGNAGQVLCSTVNNTTIESGTFGDGLWPYQGKSEPAGNEIAAGGLSEGGANLTDLGLEGCFSSILWSTRSSDSVTADPKDFILGNFEACDSTVTTTPANGAGSALTDSSDPNDVSSLPDIKIGTGKTGALVTDTASVNVTGTPSWSGTVSFFLCGPLSYDPIAPATEAPLCDSGGVAAGTKNVSNSQTTATSDQLKLTSVGRYCWRGVFASATDGVPGDTDSSAGECFEVIPVTPTLTTTAWSTGGSGGSAQTTPVAFGSPVFDKINLSGTANDPATNGDATYPSILAPATVSNGAAANNTLTVTLKGPDTASNDPECSRTATGTGATNGQTINVSGDGDYFTTAFTPDMPGDYHWVASYSGDSPNTTSTSHNTSCNVGAEDVTVQQIATQIATAPFTYPQDTASIKSAVAGNLLPEGGTVVFKLYGATNGTTAATNCTTDNAAAVVYTETKTNVVPSGGANEVTGITTSNQSFSIDSTKNGTYVWRVTYTPGATTHTGRASVCVESTAVTQTNAAYPGTLHPPAP